MGCSGERDCIKHVRSAQCLEGGEGFSLVTLGGACSKQEEGSAEAQSGRVAGTSEEQ